MAASSGNHTNRTPLSRMTLSTYSGGELQAVVELKAQVGPSFGNNANNLAEEALGNAVDLSAQPNLTSPS